MAVGYTSIGTHQSKVNSATDVVTLGTAAAVGELVVVCIAADVSIDATTTCTDSKGNVYTNANALNDGAILSLVMMFSVLTVALAVNDTLTITYLTSGVSQPAGAYATSVIKVTGFSSAVYDASIMAVGSTTTPSSGNITTGLNAIEAMIGAVATVGPSGDTFAAGSGWTGIGRIGTSGGAATGNITCAPEDKTTTAAGLEAATATLGTARSSITGIVAFGGTVSGGAVAGPAAPALRLRQAVNRAAVY
jgi:hypothetical protein